MTSKIQAFNGEGDVKVFIEKVGLYAAVKEYDEEKHAKLLGSYLQPPAFDVFARLSNEQKKNPEAIKTELLKEFDRAEINREEALKQLNSRGLLPTESFATFSYKLSEMVKLAYPNFNNGTRSTIAKDFFVKGMTSEMQIALKSIANFDDKSLNEVVTETTRLDIAGVKSRRCENTSVLEVSSGESSLVKAVANEVMRCLKVINSDIADAKTSKEEEGATSNVKESVDFVENRGYRGGQRSGGWRSGNKRQANKNNSQQPKNFRCRACKSDGHGYRNCLKRHCQACGNQGHDAWDQKCPNYC